MCGVSERERERRVIGIKKRFVIKSERFLTPLIGNYLHTRSQQAQRNRKAAIRRLYREVALEDPRGNLIDRLSRRLQKTWETR